MLDKYDGLDFEWIVKDGKTIACRANEIIQAMGLNPLHTSRILKARVFKEYYFTWSENQSGRPNLYLIEPGVWQILFTGKTEGCVALQKHIYEKVLPSIRLEGGYISESASSEQLTCLQQRITHLQSQLETEQAKTYHMVNFIENELGQAKTQAKIDWQCESSDVKGDPVVFALKKS